MAKLKRGDLVRINGKLAAVVGVPGDPNVPEDHVALWYGNDLHSEAPRPVVWTVPIEYCNHAGASQFEH